MQEKHRRARLAFFAIAVLALLAADAAMAWEWVYGPANTVDQAKRRVQPVSHCQQEGPGYIAVGTFDQGNLNPEVYVVYTPLGGGPPVWENTYDVLGFGLADEGVAIAAVPGGFVILSNVQNGGWMPALTLIKCHGGVVWSQIYPDVVFGKDLRGNDLIRTANGDLAVAGVWWNGNDEDAFLMRTNAAGALLWNIAYDPGGFEAFNALTEAGPLSTSPTPDLIAVGRINRTNGDLQGLVARVNGANGAIGAAPQCLAHHGLPTNQDVYYSVSPPILTQPNVGQFAMVGTTSNALWLDDVWVTRGNPCVLANQSRIGSPAGTVPTAEDGYDIREALNFPILGPAGGVLAIAGDHGPNPGGPYDGTFLYVGTNTLLPVAGTGRVFGDHGFRNEIFYSLEEDPAGWPQNRWILAGLTETNWEGLGDPRDLYLVHYTPPGPLVCEKPWKPVGVNLDWPEAPLQFRRQAPAKDEPVNTPFWPQWNPFALHCP
jgi:hypothetical protein